MKPHRWRRQDGRFYLVHVHVDLLGALTVTRAWGRAGSALGQVRHDALPDRDAAAKLLRRIRRVRRRHGYRRQQH